MGNIINTIKTTKTTPLAFYYSRPNLLSNNYGGATHEINYNFIIEFLTI